jgi:hypothetical protein
MVSTNVDQPLYVPLRNPHTFPNYQVKKLYLQHYQFQQKMKKIEITISKNNVNLLYIFNVNDFRFLLLSQNSLQTCPLLQTDFI